MYFGNFVGRVKNEVGCEVSKVRLNFFWLIQVYTTTVLFPLFVQLSFYKIDFRVGRFKHK
jgi:hypothetical protein